MKHCEFSIIFNKNKIIQRLYLHLIFTFLKADAALFKKKKKKDTEDGMHHSEDLFHYYVTFADTSITLSFFRALENK